MACECKSCELGHSLQQIADKYKMSKEDELFLNDIFAMIENQNLKIDRLKAKHRWIPVGERLPESGHAKMYVVTDGIGWWEEWWCDLGRKSGWGKSYDDEITHWKPITLPEEPQ